MVSYKHVENNFCNVTFKMSTLGVSFVVTTWRSTLFFKWLYAFHHMAGL